MDAVRFGKYTGLRTEDRKVKILINGTSLLQWSWDVRAHAHAKKDCAGQSSFAWSVLSVEPD